MSEMVAFMMDLATNPAKQIAFAASPTSVVAASNLSQAEQAHLLSRGAEPLHMAHADGRRTLARFFFDPGPDPAPDPDPSPKKGR